jgi:uncharacterized protein
LNLKVNGDFLNYSNNTYYVFLTIFVLFFAGTNLYPQKLPDKPKVWVSDFAGILDGDQEAQLNMMLRTYEDSTSNQVVVVTFPDAQNYPVEEFSIRLAEKWKVGQKDRENGVILAVFMKERKVRVEVGYGLEDKIPDAIAFRIAQNIVPSYFRKGGYYQGIYQGVVAIMQAASGKFKGLPKKNRPGGNSTFPLALLIFFLIFFFSLFRRRKFSQVNSRGWRSSGPFFWGGMGGGGFGRGGSSSGGGFGGFSAGGGSFGGGGATGSW